jgi:hypothetical protein
MKTNQNVGKNVNTLLIASLLLTAMLFSTAGAHAQNIFFPSKVGVTLVTEQKNGKGKTRGFTKLTVKNVEGSGNNMTISYVVEMLNKDRKSSNPPVEMPCKVTVTNGVMAMDMNQMFAGDKQQKDQQVKTEVTGVPMELPGNLQSGQTLKDAEMTMSKDLGIMKMETSMKMTDGKCLAVEDLAVPAGTFKCHKIRQSVSYTVFGKTMNALTMSWYAPGLGNVKTETYNDKGELTSSMELVEIK